MDTYLKELFDREQESGRLQYDNIPEYRTALKQVRALYSGEDLPGELFEWVDISDRISFAHGLKLGLRLGMWAGE